MSKDPIRGCIESHYANQGTIDWKYLNGTDYVLCDCTDCRLIYQKYVPKANLLDQIYNVMVSAAFLREHERTLLTVDNFENIAGELAVLFRIINKHPTKILFLDHGLGYSRWARVAKAMGAKVFGTEISAEKIDVARMLGIEIVPDDILSDMRFDIIHTEQVLEHLTEPAEDFRRLASQLAPEGIIKVAVPPQGEIRKQLKAHGMMNWSPQVGMLEGSQKETAKDRDYVSILPLEHLNAFSPRSMHLLSKDCHLKLVSRVRRQAVPLYISSGPLVLRSVIQLSKVVLRPVFRRDSGYYLFARSRSNPSFADRRVAS